MSAELEANTPAQARPRRLVLLAAVVPIVNAGLLVILVAAVALGTWASRSPAWIIALIALGVVLAFGVFAAMIAVMPRRLVERRVETLGGVFTPADRVKSENDVRLALLQAISGVLLTLGFLVTWVQLGLAQQNFNSSRDQTATQIRQNGTQLSIARTGQLAERFSRAMEQLGNASADVRIGGIYALEGLLVDLAVPSDDPALAAYQNTDQRAIIEILATYLRNHARWDPQIAPSPGAVRAPDLGARAADIQAVMNILGRHAQAVPDATLVLAGTDLSGLRLSCQATEDSSCVDLGRMPDGVGADFTECNLDSADFYGARLKNASFDRSRVTHARLARTRLTFASFRGADLTNADFAGADLTNAKLQGAKLTGATLDQAHLQNAQLQGADLSAVQDIKTADLHNAHANKDTIWPSGYDPLAAGVILD